MPSLADDPIGGVPTFRLGADLRNARERLGWDLSAIAAHLRIRAATLAALEAGCSPDLPAAAYTLGYLRTYARALGLDPDEAVRRFRIEAAALSRPPALRFPVPLPERGVPAGAAALVGVVLAVGAYAGWYEMSGGRPAEAPVREVPQRLAALVQPPAPPVPAPEPPPAVVAEAAPPEPLPPPPDLPAVPPSSAAAASPAAGAFGLAPSAAAPALPEGTRIVIRAKADAWLQVRDRQGPVLLARTLHAGETWPVPVQKAPGQLLLTTGNAGGTELLVDGEPAPALGGDGAVRRDLPLDPDAVREGKLAPPAVPARSTAKAP